MTTFYFSDMKTNNVFTSSLLTDLLCLVLSDGAPHVDRLVAPGPDQTPVFFTRHLDLLLLLGLGQDDLVVLW